MHYAQASVLAIVGLDRVREAMFGEGTYDFAYDNISERMAPEKTDLAKRVDNNHNIFG